MQIISIPILFNSHANEEVCSNFSVWWFSVGWTNIKEEENFISLKSDLLDSTRKWLMNLLWFKSIIKTDE